MFCFNKTSVFCLGIFVCWFFWVFCFRRYCCHFSELGMKIQWRHTCHRLPSAVASTLYLPFKGWGTVSRSPKRIYYHKTSPSSLIISLDNITLVNVELVFLLQTQFAEGVGGERTWRKDGLICQPCEMTWGWKQVANQARTLKPWHLKEKEFIYVPYLHYSK